MHTRFSLFGSLCGLLLLGAVCPLRAAPPTILHSFDALNSQNSNTGGAFPFGGVTQGAGGDWYGTTITGGPDGAGAVFKMHPDGSGFTVIKTFQSGNQAADGGYPSSPLTRGLDGSLYGTTSNGGANSDSISSPGTIFKISPTGQFQTLQSLPADDADTYGGGGQVFQASDGVLYGNFDSSSGFLYRMNADGTGYQTIHTFAPLNSDGTNVGGANGGLAPVEGSDGLLYGLALAGGAHGGGTFYRIAKDGTGFTVLHDFDAAPAGSLTPGPSGRLLKGLDGAFYGVTYATGAYSTGTVFRIDISGNLQTLVSFPALSSQGVNAVGANPVEGDGLRQGPDGTLYGVAYEGGANGVGTVFSIHPDGSGLADLLDFKSADIGTIGLQGGFSTTTDAGSRFHVSLGSNGLLYVTDDGGLNGTGTILSLAPSSTTHLLWTNTNGTASLWSVTPSFATTTTNFGPYSGWTARAISDAPDGSTHILWTNANGTAAVWNVVNGQYQSEHDFGPYSGWTATSLSTGGDGTSHLLWDNTNGTAAAWSLNTGSGAFTQTLFGPYSGWTAKAIASGATVTDLLWTNTDGRASGWQVGTNGSVTTHDFGPYAGWTGAALSVGPDDAAHLLWDNTNGTAALWGVNLVSGFFADVEYGPYSGWSAKKVATGPDGSSHLLWTNTNGQAGLWTVGTAGVSISPNFGPYSGWTAVAVSAGP